MCRKTILILLILVIFSEVQAQPQESKLSSSVEFTTDNETFYNPMNLDYRFHISDEVSREVKELDESYREAVDPMVILFKNDYNIIVSKSGGYYWSPNFRNRTFVEPTGLDIEKFAPVV